MSTCHRLILALADGAPRSAEGLGTVLERTAVDACIRKCREYGIEIVVLPDGRLQAPHPFVPLSADAIRDHLAARAVALPVEVLTESDSTNRYMTESRPDGPAVCLAEMQTSGHGRRGREWVATPYQNILLSLRWRFDRPPAALGATGLVAGVAVVRALADLPVGGISLKWPNDILLHGAKLGGLLVEARNEPAKSVQVVVGLGLNVWMADRDAARIDQRWDCLGTVLPAPVDRNRLAARLIAELATALDRFERAGFSAFRDEWEHHHMHRNQEITVQGTQEVVYGTALGVDELGALRLRDPSGIERRFHSGDVSVRAGVP